MSNFTFSAQEADIKNAQEWGRSLKIPAWLEFIHNVDFPVWQRPLHIHDSVEIAYIVSGTGHYRINNSVFPIRAGNVAVVESGYMHDTVSDDGSPLDFWILRLLDASFPSITGLLGQVHQGAYPVIESGVHGRLIESAFVEMEQIYRPGDPATYALCQMMVAAILSLLQYLYTNIPLHFLNLKADELPQQVALYIMDHYCEDLSLADLAEHFHVSPSHLSCEFSKAFKISPINYVIDLRFQQARTLLLRSDMPIKTVACTVGYANVYHFNNLFLKRIGCLPAEFRERFQR